MMTMLIFTPYFQIFARGLRLSSWNSTREEELLGNFWILLIQFTNSHLSHFLFFFFSFHFTLFTDFIRSHLDENNEEVFEIDQNAQSIKSVEYNVYNRSSLCAEYGRAIADIAEKIEVYCYAGSGILSILFLSLIIFYYHFKVGESNDFNM